MSNVGFIAYLAATAAFLLLGMLLVTVQRRYPLRDWLTLASLSTAAWAGVQAYHLLPDVAVPYAVQELLEVLRAASWYAFLFAAIGGPSQGDSESSPVFRAMKWVAVALPMGLLVMVGAIVAAPSGSPLITFAVTALGVGHLLLAVLGLVLVEQFYRNADSEQRWGIKFLCFGIAGLFAFDFYLFADTLLVSRVDPELWYARGAVSALTVPVIAVAVSRSIRKGGKFGMSRDMAFHSAALLGAGIYLMSMAGAGYLIRAYGGEWGGVLQVTFLVGATIMLAVLAMSGQTRARLKVFVRKHFFHNKYDYRKEWMNFTEVLSEEENQEDIRKRIVKAIANIVESPGGAMWEKSAKAERFAPASSWNLATPYEAISADSDPMVRFLAEKKWVVDLNEHKEMPGRYDHLQLPEWLKELPNARLVLPLVHQDELDAFVVLSEPRADMNFDWEDRDLLKTVGREAASYLRLVETTEALSEARQFEAFNRLSAFVVHDLKNVAAQLSLVVTNARKHQDKPEFIADAILTVDNAVNKMNRMLAQLRKERSATGTRELVDLNELLRQVVAERVAMKPLPRLQTQDTDVFVVADPDRLGAVIGHVIQNAQEATPDEGRVEVRLNTKDEWATVAVQDTGCGMDYEFVRARLFRPFDTTKGNAGMGVGAYETREFIQNLGGEVGVVSQPGKGTTFYIRVPRSSAIEQDQAALSAVR